MQGDTAPCGTTDRTAKSTAPADTPCVNEPAYGCRKGPALLGERGAQRPRWLVRAHRAPPPLLGATIPDSLHAVLFREHL